MLLDIKWLRFSAGCVSASCRPAAFLQSRRSSCLAVGNRADVVLPESRLRAASGSGGCVAPQFCSSPFGVALAMIILGFARDAAQVRAFCSAGLLASSHRAVRRMGVGGGR